MRSWAKKKHSIIFRKISFHLIPYCFSLFFSFQVRNFNFVEFRIKFSSPFHLNVVSTREQNDCSIEFGKYSACTSSATIACQLGIQFDSFNYTAEEILVLYSLTISFHLFWSNYRWVCCMAIKLNGATEKLLRFVDFQQIKLKIELVHRQSHINGLPPFLVKTDVLLRSIACEWITPTEWHKWTTNSLWQMNIFVIQLVFVENRLHTKINYRNEKSLNAVGRFETANIK